MNMTTQAQSVLAANVEKSSGRNFYAMKESNSGKTVPYGFETVVARRTWLEKHTDARPAGAMEVYRLLQKNSDEAIIANRTNRLFTVKLGSEIDISKGQRVIRNK